MRRRIFDGVVLAVAGLTSVLVTTLAIGETVRHFSYAALGAGVIVCAAVWFIFFTLIEVCRI